MALAATKTSTSLTPLASRATSNAVCAAAFSASSERTQWLGVAEMFLPSTG